MKINKKKFTYNVCILGGLSFALCYVLKRNREQAGIIRNQQLNIDGLMREVKNLSYHLGKKTSNNNM